ncbi:MAG: NAD(P)/FAD-dependent oxidoreductase [Gemmatimonadaceae bacterium]|nr:NAD(P)/FAD-dependent oxidoreductase [Gemmatimonadaceae bacterium]MCW5827143.1 NAD(P)/FAD-dependent oxidoreductase [Gemmatimonadaceae bacterium]
MSAGKPKTRVVIIGGGFGGLSAARALAKRRDLEILLIDRTNHHLFQPLLYQVATTALAPSDITAPIRWILRDQRNVTTLLGTVETIERRNRAIRVKGEPDPIHYDYLIVAPGTRHSYFGNDGWERWAPGLKSVEDARRIRKRFLLAFERAEWEEDEAARRALLTFAIVGGGPTGVELAGVLPEMCRVAFRPDFRRIDTSLVRVLLLEGGPRILPAFPERLSERAARDLTKLGVEVRVNTLVTDITEQGVSIGDEFIPTQSVFWAAGNAASPLAKALEAPLDRVGRVLVDQSLSLPDDPRVFVIGDAAAVKQPDGRWVPGVAPAANQMGKWAARNVLRHLEGQAAEPFGYFNKGDLATIGRHKAVASFFDGKLQFRGYLAWFLWLFVHIAYLVGFRNRISVLLQWAYNYIFFERGVRLITETEDASMSRHPATQGRTGEFHARAGS